jgi:hypothetical protein
MHNLPFDGVARAARSGMVRACPSLAQGAGVLDNKRQERTRFHGVFLNGSFDESLWSHEFLVPDIVHVSES